MSDERPTLPAIQHLPWEAPHRILDACGELDVVSVAPPAGNVYPTRSRSAERW